MMKLDFEVILQGLNGQNYSTDLLVRYFLHYPFIHFLVPLNHFRIMGLLEPIPATAGQSRSSPWTRHQSATEPHTHTLTPRDNSKSSTNLWTWDWNQGLLTSILLNKNACSIVQFNLYSCWTNTLAEQFKTNLDLGLTKII